MTSLSSISLTVLMATFTMMIRDPGVHMDDDLSEQHIIDCAYGHVYNDDKGS